MSNHTALAKFIHWGFVILYTYGIVKQVDELSDLEDTGLLIFEVIFASVFLLIVITRYFYMRRFKTFLGAREKVHRVHYFFAKSVHISMYICLVMLPLTGLIIAGLFSQDHTDEDGLLVGFVITLHEFSATLSYILIASHVSAAIYSRLKGEGIWSSMVPILKENKSSTNKSIMKIAKIEEQIYDRVENFFTSDKNK